jgi:hypothetical protein
VKVIALVPVRNEAWVLEHTLRSLSAFCDAVIVSDQGSTDGSRDICRRFPKVALLETPGGDSVDRLPQRARWRLLDAARGYDGHNLLWCADADELTPPDLARAFVERHAAQLTPGRVVECRFYNLWNGTARFRQDLSPYGPIWKAMAFVDDRVADYERDPARRPLHEPRIAIGDDPAAIKARDLPLLHLQFAIWHRNQTKQAWYRCIDLMSGRMTAADVNAFYQVTLPTWYVHTEEVPGAWLRELTLPDAAAADREPSWHEAEILAWFDERGVEFFEALEIWHIGTLRQEFRRRTGRNPRPDRSYLAPWPVRTRQFSRRVFNAVKRRVAP